MVVWADSGLLDKSIAAQTIGGVSERRVRRVIRSILSSADGIRYVIGTSGVLHGVKRSSQTMNAGTRRRSLRLETYALTHGTKCDRSVESYVRSGCASP